MVKIIEAKEVPTERVNCSNCNSLLEYENADLYKEYSYESAYHFNWPQYYFSCPVCGCKVKVSWIMNKGE